VYIRIPYELSPYHYQIDFLKAVKEGKNICSVIHRRAGKDTICLQAWLLRGLSRIGTHIYLFPLQKQARDVIWNGMDFNGKPFISYIPECLISSKNTARMEINLFNGSRLVLAGSNNFNSHMGSNPVTIIYSEYSLHNPLARQYMNPIIVQNGGVEIVQFTPRGKNHAFEMFEVIRENPKYFTQHLSVEQTFNHTGQRVITEEQVKQAKLLGMSDEMIRQEFYVDFDVGNLGAYFTREISDMEREGRITNLVCNPNLPLHTVWDLGGTDATAGWLFQVEGKFINLLHILHDTGRSLKYYLDKAEQIRISLGCQWGNHFMPHDVKHEHQGWELVESRLMAARKHGWFFQVTPKINFEDGIESLRYIFPKLRIDKNNCQIGLRALREYQREYDELKACYKPKPLDNWATHIVDATRYLGVNYRRLFDIPHPPQTYTSSL
jgi:phage terminase large subunit